MNGIICLINWYSVLKDLILFCFFLLTTLLLLYYIYVCITFNSNQCGYWSKKSLVMTVDSHQSHPRKNFTQVAKIFLNVFIEKLFYFVLFYFPLHLSLTWNFYFFSSILTKFSSNFWYHYWTETNIRNS